MIAEDADDEADERLSFQMSRWAMHIDPDLAQAEESLAIFPTEKQLLTMVENRKRFRARSPEHWAQSCLNARRKSYEIGEHYLTPEQRARLDEELYPHRPNKRRRIKNPLTPSWSIAANRESDAIPDHEIVSLWVEKEKNRLAEVAMQKKEKRNAPKNGKRPQKDSNSATTVVLSPKKLPVHLGLLPLQVDSGHYLSDFNRSSSFQNPVWSNFHPLPHHRKIRAHHPIIKTEKS